MFWLAFTTHVFGLLIELCDSLELNEHVFFHGSAEGKTLDEIYLNCHLLILIGHDDAICNGSYQGVFSVANDDSEIALGPIWHKVREFYESQNSADNRSSAIKEFSWEYLVSEPLKIING